MLLSPSSLVASAMNSSRTMPVMPGKARSQAIGARPHVTLLAAPHQRKSAGHQQAVAGRDAGCPGGGDPRTTQGPRDASVESSMFGIANLGSALTIYRLT
jgi:hypothetical protein